MSAFETAGFVFLGFVVVFGDACAAFTLMALALVVEAFRGRP